MGFGETDCVWNYRLPFSASHARILVVFLSIGLSGACWWWPIQGLFCLQRTFPFLCSLTRALNEFENTVQCEVCVCV